jgi:hypothetical protein
LTRDAGTLGYHRKKICAGSGAAMAGEENMRAAMIAVAMVGFLGALTNPATAGPVASTDGEASGVRLDVQDLKVANGVATLRFTVVNDAEKGYRPELQDRDGGEGWSVDGVYLVDAANKKKYLVVRDSEKHCLCSRSLSDFPAKSSLNLWAKFPAPPDSVQKIGVVVPHFIPLDDVPIAR